MAKLQIVAGVLVGIGVLFLFTGIVTGIWQGFGEPPTSLAFKFVATGTVNMIFGAVIGSLSDEIKSNNSDQ